MPNDNALLGSRDGDRPTVCVRPAVADEIDAIWQMYAAVCDDMRGKPWDVDWVMGEHPIRESLVADIEAGRLLVAVADDTPPRRPRARERHAWRRWRPGSRRYQPHPGEGL